MNVEEWDNIEEEFDNITDMRERVRFLRKLIDKSDICNNTTCEVFPDLHQFKSHVKDLNIYDCYSIEIAKKKITNEIDLRNFKKLYLELDNFSEHVFSKIFAMFTSKKTKENQLKIWHKRQIELMKVQNKSNLAISQEFLDDSQVYVDKVQENITDLEMFKKAKKKMEEQAK